jgi:D-3-phosphoglycerate dehydrogenase
MNATVVFSERLGPRTPPELEFGERLGVTVETRPLWTLDDIIREGGGADVIVAGAVEPFTRDALAALPSLSGLVRRGIGVDNVDLDAATDLGIPVGYVPAASVEEVSDHALALALSQIRRLPGIEARVRADDLPAAGDLGNLSRPFNELTLGIVGFGRIGRALARKASSVFGGVIATDPMLPSGSTVDGVPIVEPSDVWAGADVISLHAPAIPGIGPIVGPESIEAMRQGVVIVNTARGALVDEEALVAAIHSGRIGGAALDVTAVEPLPTDSPLFGVPGLVLTGHTAARGGMAAVKLERGVLDAVEALLAGAMPESLANPAVLQAANLRSYLAGRERGGR